MKKQIRLKVVFYQTSSGNEPVREWLKRLERPDKKTIGEDIKTVQLGWPLGMPLVRKLDDGLWEVRSSITHGIARVTFTVHQEQMILLHGFIKKSKKTPTSELQISKKRLKTLREVL